MFYIKENKPILFTTFYYEFFLKQTNTLAKKQPEIALLNDMEARSERIIYHNTIISNNSRRF